jgi:hypothetical protein
MKQNVFLTIASIVRGIEKGGLSNLTAVPILVLGLYATLVLGQRRSGYIIILLGSLLGAGVPVIHFMRVGGVVGGRLANLPGNFFFVWTLLALGVTAVFSLILSARGLWGLARGKMNRPVAQP